MKVVLNCGLAVIAYLLLGAASAHAQPADHIGNYCVTCHQRFSYEKAYASELTAVVKNPDVLSFKPCNSDLCHRSKPPGAVLVDRYSLHVKENICGNCHPKKDGNFDIHKIHSNFAKLDLDRPSVECRICHAQPEGFNSTHVMVPPYNVSGNPFENIRKPPWKGQCSYCHPSANITQRLHDVHSPGLRYTCASCHGEEILTRLGLVETIAGNEVDGKQKATRKRSALSSAFFRLFTEIAYQLYNAADRLRGALT